MDDVFNTSDLGSEAGGLCWGRLWLARGADKMGVSHVGSYQTAGRRYSYRGGGVVRLMGGWDGGERKVKRAEWEKLLSR